MRTEESEQEIDEFKFLNVKEVQVVGTQLHVYPAYGERDLMIENDVEALKNQIRSLETKLEATQKQITQITDNIEFTHGVIMVINIIFPYLLFYVL